MKNQSNVQAKAVVSATNETKPSTRSESLAAIAIAVAFVVGILLIGQRTAWSVPRFSQFVGHDRPIADDWCAAHSVPQSICVQCKKQGDKSKPDLGWCQEHGVHDCPLCDPTLAQTATPATVTDEDRRRSARALAFTPRVANNSRCKLHERVIQLTNTEVMHRLGMETAAARLAPVTESIQAPGEISFDPSRVARLSPKVAGNIWWVARQAGERVQRGEVLALIEAPDLGRCKSELQQAIIHLEHREQALANLNAASGAVAGKQRQDAEAALEEATIRLLQAEQALANLGLPVSAESLKTLPPKEVAKLLQFLGIPTELAARLAQRTESNSLMAVQAPFDGEIVARAATIGERADSSIPLFTVVDSGQMILSIHVRLEDANRIKPGDKVIFQHAGHDAGDEGRVEWISPIADEKSRTVAVRATMANDAGTHHAKTFGTARIVLREEAQAVVVPSSAVHWEGDCNVVFVRDKNFEQLNGLKLFHVRKVRPGAEETEANVSVTEIAAGLLPGEHVATTNSGFLRSELLKARLGAG